MIWVGLNWGIILFQLALVQVFYKQLLRNESKHACDAWENTCER